MIYGGAGGGGAEIGGAGRGAAEVGGVKGGEGRPAEVIEERGTRGEEGKRELQR